MDDKKLEDLLNEIKHDYEKLPEHTDTKNIMQKLSDEKKKSSGREFLPGFAVAAGIILFMLVSLPYVNEFQQGKNQTEFLEMYYLEKKEEFRERLGIENVDSFEEVKLAEEIVEEHQSTNDSDRLNRAKSEIDYAFTTPNQLVGQLNDDGKLLLTDEDFSDKMLRMRSSFQSYFSNLLKEHGMDVYERNEAVEAQENIGNYEGPSEMADFLHAINEQGFRIIRLQNGTETAEIQVDLQWIYDNSENLESMEGYKRFLELSTTMIDHYNPGARNEFETPWTEFDTILLEIEDLFESYPEERDLLFNELELNYTAIIYLNDYILGGAGISWDSVYGKEIVDESAKAELRNFAEEHKDSRFAGIVDTVVKEYEENGWVIKDFFVMGELWFLFDEDYDHISYGDVIESNTWPITETTKQNYSKYNETKDLTLLNKLASLEILSIYMYAAVKEDTEISEELASNIKRSEQANWFQIVNDASYIIRTREDEKRAVYQFVRGSYGETEVIAEVQMMKEDGLWKISNQEIN